MSDATPVQRRGAPVRRVPHRAGGVFAAVLALALGTAPACGQPIEFTPSERAAIQRHGPWPQPVLPDPSNRASGQPAAIALGERLFFEGRLSPGGGVSCAHCHRPEHAWTDARRTPEGAARPSGRERLNRNTPTLWNAGLGRWFGWGGGSDALWSFHLRPLLHPLEMAADPAHVASTLRGDAELACRYRGAFGDIPADDMRVLVDVAKAVAAFVETLVSGETPFDRFREALARGDAAAVAAYPAAAQRGLRIFVGRGHCSLCHFGPAFTNGEFADVGVPYFVPGGGVDSGRYAGIQRLRDDPHNLLGAWSDDATRASGSKTRHVHLQPRNFGEFKVPGLRNVARTAPYMHDGSLATLADVVKHYSELDESRLHADGERVLRPLRLSAAESADLVAFLESLSDDARYVSAASSPCASPPAR